MCSMPYLHVWHDSFVCATRVTWLLGMWGMPQFVRTTTPSHLRLGSFILIERNPPPSGGVSYLLCSLIHNPEEEEPPRRIGTRCFAGGPLPPRFWLGNIINRKSPPRGGFLRLICATWRTFICTQTHTHTQPIDHLVRQVVRDGNRVHTHLKYGMAYLNVWHTPWCVGHDLFNCVTWLIPVCDLTHFHMRHDSLIWLNA